MIHVLHESPGARARVRRVLEHAHKPENHYRPSSPTRVPGSDPRHIVILAPFKCVFSITWFPSPSNAPFRHLTVSNHLCADQLPAPSVIQFLAPMFGFTGDFLLDWHAGPHEAELCVVVWQKLALEQQQREG
jgi:hypothetical protein